MSDVFYLVNRTASNLHVKDFVSIPPYKHKELPHSDRTHADVLAAVDRGWARISDVEPGEGDKIGQLEIAVPESPMQGLSEAELKEFLADKTDEVQVNVEKFGDKPTEKTSEAKAEALGADTQPQGEPKAEALGEPVKPTRKKNA